MNSSAPRTDGLRGYSASDPGKFQSRSHFENKGRRVFLRHASQATRQFAMEETPYPRTQVTAGGTKLRSNGRMSK